LRRSISAIMLALAAGILSPAASAAASTQLLAAPQPQDFGVRLVDVPVSEANDPRALRYIIDYLPVGTIIHRRILIMNGEARSARLIDTRGFGAGWTATVSSTDFTTGGGSPAETIPASDATYGITGLAGATGLAIFTNVIAVSLSGSPQAVVSASTVNGNTAVTWDPTIQVAVPAGAIGGTYTATITHSVS
jgi:hypothetical protein